MLEIDVPNWLLKTKVIRSNNCRSVYKDTLDNKLGIIHRFERKVGCFLDWKEIQIEIKKSNIKTKEEYLEKRNFNWPSAPHLVYKDQWKGWLQFLTGKERPEFLSFKECRAEVINCKITSQRDYLKRKRPNWPYEPQITYKKEWKGWTYFRGEKSVDFLPFDKFINQLVKHKIFDPKTYKLKRKPEWPSEPHNEYKGKWKGWLGLRLLNFEECRSQVLKCNFKSMEEYKRKRKWNWPCNPCMFYKEKWQGINYFLGTKKERFLSFEDCKKEIVRCGIKTMKEYSRKRKVDWPSNPKLTYGEKWKGYEDFLSKKCFPSFEQCRKEVLDKKFKSRDDYMNYVKSFGPNWPILADSYYKKRKKWRGWLHFLGKKQIHSNNFLAFKECLIEVRKYKFKNLYDYGKNRKPNWPSNPNVVYKNKGWKGYAHFLRK